MEILVAILIIALIAAVVFAVMQRRSSGAHGSAGPPARSPIGRRERGASRRDPMAGAVAEHAQAMEPHDVVAAEQRMQAQARQVAAGLHTEAHRSEHQRAADQLAHGHAHADPRLNDHGPATAHRADGYADPATAHRADGADPASHPHADGYADPANDRRADGYADPAADPRLDDKRYDGRLAADYVDPRDDDRRR